MNRLGRRRFLVHGSVAAASLGAAFSALMSRRATAREYGPLVQDPDQILDLPEGFSYVILDRYLDRMDDGYSVPGAPDGMACFDGGDGTFILMRNHEVNPGFANLGPYGVGEAPPEAYDDTAYGGVTRVVIDAETLERVSSNLVLAGTIRNCAGGPSPWGWLSCEENVDDQHGYVFVCPIDAATVAPAERVVGYGRFYHEAAAVDPETLRCYLTEDRGDSCVYRFDPADPGTPFEGTLQALRVVGQDQLDTSVGLQVGDELMCDWVDITEPDPVEDTVRDEGHAAGAAIFSRGEGIWFHEGVIYISCTNGGPADLGQIWTLVDDGDTATLTLLAQSEDADILDFPDNITVSPWGQLFIAEDGDRDNYIRAISDTGDIVTFARNALSDSELSGVCFSPDGRAMFVNIQADGRTLMITGPFPGVDVGGSDTGDTESGGLDETGDPDGTTTDIQDETTSNPNPSTTTADTSGAQDDDGGSGDGCGCHADGSSPAGLLGTAAALGAGLLARQRPGDDEPDPT